MPVPTTDGEARISLFVFSQRPIHPVIEVTGEINREGKLGLNPVRFVRQSREIRRGKATVLFRECLLGSHNVVCRRYVFRHSFQLGLVLEWIGVISRKLESDLFLRRIF